MKNTLGKKAALIPALFLMHSGLTQAETQIPDSGNLLQQTIPTLPAMPAPNETGIGLEQGDGVTDNTPFTVTKINFTGNTSVPTEALQALVKDIEGTEQTLTKLQNRVYLISDYYHDQGYPFARAIIPQQEITNGEVTIEIIEAKYGEIKLNNSSRVSDGLIESTLSPLTSGTNIEQKQLDRALLLLTEVQGLDVNASVEPGKEVGTSDLVVNAATKSNFIGRVNIDDYGNDFINRQRAGASLNFLNPLKHGDVLSLNLLTTGSRMQYGQISYDYLLNGAGTHIGVSASTLKYDLGSDALSTLDVHGSTKGFSAWVKHPFVRSKAMNMYGQVNYNYNEMEDSTGRGGAKIENDRTVRTFSLALNGDVRDQFLSSAVNSWRIEFGRGDVDFDNIDAQNADAASAKTRGDFSKWNLNLNRLQSLTEKTDLWLSVSAQMANKNLDSSQKMVFGGPFSVRAYDSGSISGDNGHLATVELRHLLSQSYGYWQAVVFADYGHVEVNENNFGTAKNTDSIAGVGLGLNWSGNNMSAKAHIATSVGSASSITKEAKSIAWVEFSVGF